MKKTLISLFSVACMTLAGQAIASTTATDITVLNTSVVGFSNFSGLGSTADYGTAKSSVTVGTGTAHDQTCITFTGTTFTGLSGTRNVLSQAYVLDLGALSAVTLSSSGYDFLGLYNCNSFGVAVASATDDSEGKVLQAVWSNALRTELLTDALPTEGKLLFVMTCDGSGMTFYTKLLGEETTTSKNASGLKASSLTGNTFYINQDLTSTVEQVYLFNTSLTTAQVATAMNEMASFVVVPEPATASLSMLALAGLILRRKSPNA